MKTPIGMDKDSGEVRHIYEVARGLACNCRCPNDECKADLIAKFCKTKIDHFAHYKAKGGRACKEKALHLMGKSMIAESRSSYFPLIEKISAPRYSKLGERFQESATSCGTLLFLKSVECEVYLQDLKIRPDLLCTVIIDGQELITAIEVKVTHAVDDAKLKKIQSGNLNSFEIDLSDLVDVELTTAVLREALSEGHRYKWLHVSDGIDAAILSAAEELCLLRWGERNAEIEHWCGEIETYWEKRGFIRLPAYEYPDNVSELQTVKVGWKEFRIDRDPPQIRPVTEFVEVAGVRKNIMNIKVRWKSTYWELPIVIERIGSQKAKLSKSYLRYYCDAGLPAPEDFEKFMVWGRSELAERYLSWLHDERRKIVDRETPPLEARVSALYNEYNTILKSRSYPLSSDLSSIRRIYETARDEMSAKGIPVEYFIVNHHGDWIFGCPHEYWQTILVRTLCLVNSPDVNVQFYAKTLKKFSLLEAVEPLRSLSFNRKLADRMGLPIDAIPTVYGVLADYFSELHRLGLLRRNGRGRYAKLIAFGEDYRQLQANT